MKIGNGESVPDSSSKADGAAAAQFQR